MLLAGAMAALCVSAAQNVAQTEGVSEHLVKAAYLYNFAKSAEWPGQSLPGGEPLVIGVAAGDDEFIDLLKKTIAGRSIGTHSVAVKRIDTNDQLKSCHLIFFRSSWGRKRTESAISALGGARVLLVGEEEGFLGQGGMINLVLKNGTVRFEVDGASVERAGLRLSQRLLALADSGNGSSNDASTESAGTGGESRRLKASTLPEYPEIAQKMNIKGLVQVEATVRRDGTVREVRVIGGHPLLAEALVKAVMGWQYEPAAKDSQVRVRFVFGQ